jgi:hypothetical protein
MNFQKKPKVKCSVFPRLGYFPENLENGKTVNGKSNFFHFPENPVKMEKS